jgi:hypothetical protein
MRMFKRWFGGASPPESSKGNNPEDGEELRDPSSRLGALFTDVLQKYHATSCQCAYPRFRALVAIDCMVTGGRPYQCFESEMLIDMSKQYFDVGESSRSDEDSNKEWVCKTCGSTYEYGWTQFSIALDRQQLRLSDLKVESVGKSCSNPTPVFVGTRGYSRPSALDMEQVDFDDFRTYMLEM